jgi:glycosyltransferase involved in cell wall biosynthesis
MHVAFNGWFWDQPNAGSGQYIRRLLHNLRRVDPTMRLTLVLPPHNNEPDDLPDDIDIVTTKGRGGKVGKVLFEQRTFPRMADRVAADIAHVPYWGPPLKTKARLVTSVLDVIPLALPDYSRGIANRLYVSLVRAAAAGSAHIITISEAARDDIVSFLDMSPESISVTYLGVDERFHPKIGAAGDAEIRRKYGLPERFVLYLGSFDKRKNVESLLEAYTYVAQAEGQEIPLVLAGKEPLWGTSMFPDLRKTVEALDLTHMVHWTGYVDEADKPAFYRLADVFVFPSIYEGFGLPPLEAMACGTPTVANAMPLFSETLADGAYLVKDARAMAGAIIALLIQDPLRRTMINQGLARSTHFTWRKTAEGTLAVYNRVMGR